MKSSTKGIVGKKHIFEQDKCKDSESKQFKSYDLFSSSPFLLSCPLIYTPLLSSSPSLLSPCLLLSVSWDDFLSKLAVVSRVFSLKQNLVVQVGLTVVAPH